MSKRGGHATCTLQMKSLKKDKEIVMEAINQQGNYLEYADPTLRKDKTIVMTAIKSTGCISRIC